MPAKPGTRPPNAGRGRKKGSVNVVTRTTREMFSAFVDHNAEKAQALFDRVARKNPARALQLLGSFAEFTLPRLQRTDMNVSTKPTATLPSFVDMDPIAASRAYQEFIAAPAGTITFKDPEHSREWYAERNAQRAHEAMLAAGKVAPAQKPAPRIAAPVPKERTVAAEAPISGYGPTDEPVRARVERPAAELSPPVTPSKLSKSKIALWEKLAEEADATSALDAQLRTQRPPYIVT
jgi:hypothetical protein